MICDEKTMSYITFLIALISKFQIGACALEIKNDIITNGFFITNQNNKVKLFQ